MVFPPTLVSLILFAIFVVQLIRWVQERVSRDEGLAFLDSVRQVATQSDENENVRMLQASATVSIDWIDRRERECDTERTEAALFTRRRGHKKHLHPKLTAKIRVRNYIIKYI